MPETPEQAMLDALEHADAMSNRYLKFSRLTDLTSLTAELDEEYCESALAELLINLTRG